MAGPIKPSEVGDHKTSQIPEEVFKVFNDMIAQKWDGYRAVISQREAATRISEALTLPRSEVFSRHLLDVEVSYTAAGWEVVYDKPGYNETYEPTFMFRKSGK